MKFMKKTILIAMFILTSIFTFGQTRYYANINYVKNNIERAYIASSLLYSRIMDDKSLFTCRTINFKDDKESFKYDYKTKKLTIKAPKQHVFNDIYVAIKKINNETCYIMYLEVGDNIYTPLCFIIINANGRGYINFIIE